MARPIRRCNVRRLAPYVTTLIVIIGTLLGPSATLAARPTPPTSCGPLEFEGNLPAAAEGRVTRQTITVTADCELVVGPAEDLPADALVRDDAGLATDEFGSITDSAKRERGGLTTMGSGSGCCWGAYAVQRSWDCCGIKMNEYWTEIDYTKNSSGVINWWSARDGGAWHREYTCGGSAGWWPANDHALYRSAGGVGTTSVSVAARQGYDYRGAFDACQGGVFYNQYSNSLTGKASGGWTCNYSFYWKNSAPGWSYQAWCGTGNY